MVKTEEKLNPKLVKARTLAAFRKDALGATDTWVHSLLHPSSPL